MRRIIIIIDVTFLSIRLHFVEGGFINWEFVICLLKMERAERENKRARRLDCAVALNEMIVFHCWTVPSR